MEKEFDLIIFGGSGFTGKLVLEYMSEKYSHLNWAVAGRNLNKLTKIAEDLKINKPILELDSSNAKNVENAKKAKEYRRKKPNRPGKLKN